jgi:hypothetical protein
MGSTPIDSLTAIFGEPISTYTRADMIRDGGLVEADPDLAKNAGFRCPVAHTAAVVEDCITWTDADEARKNACQDQTGREWDVLFMASLAIRCASRGADRARFTVTRVPRDGGGHLPRPVILIAHIGGDDVGEPCITIMKPEDD